MYQGGYPGQPGYPQPGYPGGMQQCYVIASHMHGMALDIERGVANPGTRVMPWTKHGKDNQQWYDDPSTGTIRSKLNGFCLDIEGDQSLRVMPYQPGDPNQQWERDAQGYIRNRVQRNKVLDIFNQSRDAGAKVGMWDANGGQNQLWHFEFVGGQSGYPAGGAYPPSQSYPAGGSYPQGGAYPPAGGYPDPSHGHHHHHGGQGGYPQMGAMYQRREFHIVSDMNGLVADIKHNNTNPGAEVIMWNKKSPPARNQLWYVDQQGVIRSAFNDLALDAPNGQKLKMQPFNGGAHQQWILEGNKIVNRGTGDCLDICGENHVAGADICSWRYKGSRNQHWRVEYIN